MTRRTRILGAVAGTLLVVLLAFLAFNWAPDRPVEALATRWAAPPSQFVAIDGMRVHLRDEGPRDDPRPIILLHGTSSSLHTWDGWAEALRTRRRVIRVDLPGFGLTGPTPDGTYTIERYVAFMKATLDHFAIEHCTLVGNSFGGWIAWETALAEPGRVGRLVLVDSAGYRLDSVSVPIGFRVAKIPVLNQLVKFTLPRGLVESSLRNVYGDPDRVTPELVDRYFDLTTRAGNRAALVQRFQQSPPGVDAPRISGIRTPTLILWGGRDRLIPPAHAERFHRDIAGSQVLTFDDLGHVPHEEDPARTLAAALPFLNAP
jgi:pimeloyl-ACP methyl ester carboxylesterase